MLAELVRALAGAVLVAEAGDGDELRAALRAARPDLLIVDDRLLDGAALADAPARTIVVGMDDHPGFADRALRRGAAAWIAKDEAAARLPELLARAAPADPLGMVRAA
jgi:DNA-binding NarL/FixJ family response regulator